MGLAIVMTPISISIAKKLKIIDTPRDGRRMHEKPIPRFGGLAIFVATTITILMAANGNDKVQTALIGGSFMYLLGVLDDIKDIKAGYKFIGQLIIASAVYAMGLRIEFISDYFGTTTADPNANIILSSGLAYVITVLWIVGITNAVNLMDGMDGLAAGSVAIMSLSLAYVAYIHGDTNGMMIVCISLVAVAGACMGFLPFNFSPAKTFMGDGGALFLGYMIAVFSVISPLKRATFIGVVIPIFVLAVPIFDTLFAMVRRVIRHQSIMTADKGHLHHRLTAAGFGQRRSVLIMYGIVGIMGIVAVLISRELYKDATFLTTIAILYLVIILVPKQTNKDIRKNEKKNNSKK